MAHGTTKDNWDKISALGTFFGAFLGPFAIGLIGFIVTSRLSSNEAHARKAQLYASVVTERENAYSEIREKMFDSLISHYFNTTLDAPIQTELDFDKRLTMLELLLDNFDDYFNVEPLFWLLHKQITEKYTTPGDEKKWEDLDQRLIRLARGTSAREGATLAARGGAIIDQVLVPPSSEVDFAHNAATMMPDHIALYSPAPRESKFALARTAPEKKTRGDRYSITIEVHSFSEVSAQVSVFVFRDIYRGEAFDHSELMRKIDFESSYFSTPYVDNTLIGSDRFSLIYQGCFDFNTSLPCRLPLSASANPIAQFKVVIFDQEFMSQKEGPYIDEVIEKVAE